MSATYFQLDGIGAAFTATDDGSAASSYAVGTKLPGNKNTTFLRVQCGSAAGASNGNLLGIDSSFRASKLTPAKAVSGDLVAVAVSTMTADAFGWVATEGVSLNCVMLTTALTGIAVGIGSSDGMLALYAATGNGVTLLEGIHVLTEPSSAQAVGTVTMQFPHAG